MAYVNYNRAMYRTGFRPYGHSNPWAASQLNGYSVREALGQNHPFQSAGGWRLHGLEGSASFHPWVLRGLGESVCLGPDENTIACVSPDCTYGDCGSTDTQHVGGSLCLDEKENQIACSSPACRYGDCVPTVVLKPGPANRVTAPVDQFSQTSQRAASTVAQQPAWMKGTIINGIPDLFLYGGAFLLAASVLLPPGGRRR